MSENWNVYIIECRDNKLYVGIAKDVQCRVEEHNRGLACRFTKYRCPVKLLWSENFYDYKSAYQREKELKGFSRKKKFQVMSQVPRPDGLGTNARLARVGPIV